MSARLTTMHGHDNRCGLCALRVYSLWMAAEPPPFGCCEGHDAAPWLCGHVLNSLAMAVIRVDHLSGDLLPHHEHIIRLLGKERSDAIFAHIREHNSPPKAGSLRDPDYSRPAVN